MRNEDSVDRRDFIKAAALAGAGLALGCKQTASSQGGEQNGQIVPASRNATATMVGFTTPPMQTVRIGFVGTGKRGKALIRFFSHCPGVQINAVCDVVPDRAAEAQALVEKLDSGKPQMYTNGDHDFERLNERDDLDLVITATPWEWHVPVVVDAMHKGKHAASEVPAALTVADCWKLVDTVESTRRHYMMTENCCYGEAELAILNASRQGVFGEILHGEGGYLHDLQAVKFDLDSEGAWRTAYSKKFNGNLYPTHGLGPIAHCMNINRGDRFKYIVSMSSPSRGLQEYTAEQFGKNDPRATAKYIEGDVNTSLIQTMRGKTIMLQHQTNDARPYSRINTIVGSKGLFAGYPDRIGLGETWGDVDAFKKKYQHPLWAKVTATVESSAKSAAHGGMDYVMAYRMIDCLHRGLPLDMNVYDAAAWSCICELSCKSVAHKSAAIDFPDFTRGKWETTEPLGIVS